MTDTARATDPEPDDVLLERWRSGDERAASALVARHAPALSRYAASLGAWEEAAEVVQDTFVRAFDSIDSFRRESSLRTWLFTILRRLVLDRRRATGRSGRLEELDDGRADSRYDALDGLVAAETERRIMQAVARLTRMQREVFTLRVSEGLSYRDIANVLGSTEGAARVHYHSALRAVKEILDD